MTSSSRRSWLGQFRLNWEYRRDIASNPVHKPERNTYIPRPVGEPCTCGANHRVNDVDWSGISRPITITYRAGTERFGAVQLRGFQLADMLQSFNPGHQVRLQTLEGLYRSRPRNHIIIVLKTAVRPKSLPLLKRLRRDGNRVLFDMVDGQLESSLEFFPDAYICSSITEAEYRTDRGHRTIVSLQSPDQRTPVHSFSERAFSPVYYGLVKNGAHLAQLHRVALVEFRGMPPHRSESALPEELTALAAHTHHYAVRAWNEDDGFKPMMKGFFAARFGAVVIASAQDEESLRVLGDDYPYLASSSSLTDVQDILDYAEQTHVGPVWRKAVATMKLLRERSCPVATAKDLLIGLRRLGL